MRNDSRDQETLFWLRSQINFFLGVSTARLANCSPCRAVPSDLSQALAYQFVKRVPVPTNIHTYVHMRERKERKGAIRNNK